MSTVDLTIHGKTNVLGTYVGTECTVDYLTLTLCQQCYYSTCMSMCP